MLRLIGLAHDGPFEVSPWQSFLRALREAIGAGYASIVFRRDAATDLIEFRDAPSTSIDVDARCRADVSARPHDALPYLALTPNRLYDVPALLEPADPQRQAFFHEFLEPAGLRSIRMARVVDRFGPGAWLTVARPASGSDFTAQDDALLADLLPFVAQSVRTFAVAEAGQVEGEVAGRVARALGIGCVFVERSGRITRIDAAARALLERRGVEHLSAGERLRFTIGGAEAELRHALREAGEGRGAGPVVLRGGEDIDLLLVPLRMRAVPRADAPVAVLFVGSSRTIATSGGRTPILATLFGLTVREAELALNLAGGETLAGAAAKLGITAQTARFYSKRIYAKMGVSGQADLIRRILTSVAMVV